MSCMAIRTVSGQPIPQGLSTHLEARAQQGEEVAVHDECRVQSGADAAHVCCNVRSDRWQIVKNVSCGVAMK